MKLLLEACFVTIWEGASVPTSATLAPVPSRQRS
ncbi:unnamed protein product [Linum tenue]|uniref:Uncharacterized protein n=1 Tax=Linum tenue TaxID=586396 RepID=A0AAV0LP59_9ROSI|nr:unnamed protein product [Linum tenue]